MSWNRLEHQVWNQIKLHDLHSKTLILTVSGGLDSMVMLSVFQRLNLKTPVIVVHFHHGDSDDLELLNFRDSAQQMVRNKTGSLVFISKKSHEKLSSEADLRRARRNFIETILKSHQEAVVVTAHHQNDLLETLMIKMMRGAGLTGLKNFKEFNGRIWRPFLLNQKEELKTYALERQLQWVEDPSNQDTKFLRNWLRHDLLPRVEFRHSGALRNLLNSIDRLLKEATPDQFFLSTHREKMKTYFMAEQKNCFVIEIDRVWYGYLERSSQQKVLFLALKQAQMQKIERERKNPVSNQEKQSPFWDVTKGRVQEIMKRLDKNQKDIKFNLGPLKALTSSKKIVLQFEV